LVERSELELQGLADAYESSFPVVELWAKHGIYSVVGNGEITNDDPDSPKRCGKFYGFVGCVHTELHNKTTLDGVNHRGMAYVRKRFRRCFNPRCPKCMKAWAVREAKSATRRIERASVKYGLAEHIICSTPKFEYPMFDEGYSGYLKGRGRLREILDSRGVIGGLEIFHGFRFASRKESRMKGVPFGWYWSVHWHILGFLVDGYSKCRSCAHNCNTERDHCRACPSFEGRTRRAFDNDGWIVKVLDKRKTLIGTIYYQLNHATIISSKRRFHPLTWFGVCAIRVMKLDKADFKENPELCPICQSECIPLTYLGFDKARIVKEVWIKEFEEQAFDKDGLPVWVPKVGGSSAYYCGGGE